MDPEGPQYLLPLHLCLKVYRFALNKLPVWTQEVAQQLLRFGHTLSGIIDLLWKADVRMSQGLHSSPHIRGAGQHASLPVQVCMEAR